MKSIVLATLFLSHIAVSQFNLNFESWVGDNPEDWEYVIQNEGRVVGTNNYFKKVGGPTTSLMDAEGAPEGNLAIHLQTTHWNNGIIFFPDTIAGMIRQDVPCEQRLDSISFYFKGRAKKNDKGILRARLLRWEGMELVEIGEAKFLLEDYHKSWTKASAKFNYVDLGTPHVLVIEASSSAAELLEKEGIPSPGSELWLDDLRLWENGLEISAQPKIKCYPDFDSGVINITFPQEDGLVLIVHDDEEKVMYSEIVTDGYTVLDIKDYTKGAYRYDVYNLRNERIYNDRFILSVPHVARP